MSIRGFQWQPICMSSAVDTVRPLTRTRQYREFTSEPVSDETLDALVRVARWSGSAGNAQPWRFIVVTDVGLIRRVAEMAMPQTRGLPTAMAALVITLPDDASRESIDTYDDGRVAERILIAASMLGIGAGIQFIQKQFRPQVHEALGVPDGRFIRTIMALGHPTDAAKAQRAATGEARVPLEELVEWRR